MQHAVCHMVRRDDSAVSLTDTDIVFILALVRGQKQLTDGGKEETRVPGENSDDELQKMPHIKGQKFKPETRTHTLVLVSGALLVRSRYRAQLDGIRKIYVRGIAPSWTGSVDSTFVMCSFGFWFL